MPKMWINPNFKDLYQKDEEPLTKGQRKTGEKKSDIESWENKKKRKKINPAEEYITRKMKERKKLKIKFIDDEMKEGIIQWVDQRYIKIQNEEEGLLIEKRAIKYIK